MSISPPHERPRKSFRDHLPSLDWLPVSAAAIYSAIVFSIIPKWVIVMNDDFGYLSGEKGQFIFCLVARCIKAAKRSGGAYSSFQRGTQ